MVSPLVPVLLFVGNGVLFLTFGLVAARLQYRFMKRYPDTAQEVMPEAFWGDTTPGAGAVLLSTAIGEHPP